MNVGLSTSAGQTIPLEGIEIEGEVVAGQARLRARQHYRNRESQVVEAVYVFPLPAEGAITAFAMSCAGQRFEAELQEREQAFRAYDEAVLHGHGAALLEQERRNVFCVTVGNVLPGEETLIEIAWLQRLTPDEGTLRLKIPTLVAPRYVPGTPGGERTGHGTAEPTDRVPDADRITPPVGDARHRASLDLALDFGCPVTVTSPSHRLRVEETSATGRRIRFALTEEPLDRDVVLLVAGLGDLPLAGLVAHRVDDTAPGAFALTVLPDLGGATASAPPLEVVFLIDVSGSMAGDSIREARDALQLCLRQLRAGDRFGLLAFNVGFACFQPALVAYSEATLAEADRWVRQLEANGGTALREPLLAALDLAPDGVLVLLTDGQVGNEAEILRAALARRGRARLYGFGIGTNVNEGLLADLARETGGAVEEIHPGERIHDKVVAHFARATAPRIDALELHWSGRPPEELTPAVLPPLVDGEPWTLFGSYSQPGHGELEIRGRLGEVPFRLAVPFELPERAESPAVPVLWAGEKVREVERLIDQVADPRRAKRLREELVRLSLAHGLLCRATAFVVVEKRQGERRHPGVPALRVVPVAAPAGWAMFERVEDVRRMAFQPMRTTVATTIHMCCEQSEGPQFMMADPLGVPAELRASKARASRGRASEAASFAKGEDYLVPAAASDPVAALFTTQLASGLWDDPVALGPAELQPLEATLDRLRQAFAAGVDASHPVYGRQVSKAIAAVLAAVERLAPDHDPAIERLLAGCWLVAATPRRRARVTACIAARELARLELVLEDEAAMRALAGW